MTALDTLADKISSRTARIGVVGLGYVGLPLILRLSEAGFPTAGFDINEDHVAGLAAGQSPFNHIADAAVADLAQADTLLTSDFARAAEVEALILCLPTPLDRYRQPDLSYVVKSMEALAPYLHPGMLISLESTTWPGTTTEVMRPIIEAQNLEIGTDVALVFSPEREDPGNEVYTIRQIPKVLGGETPRCRDLGEQLYSAIVDQVVPVSSTRAAELTKLLENIQRSVNIGLMNEMKQIANAMDIDIFEVVNAAATKPFGFTRYTPGPGLGGHCIPIDPFYLTWKAREYGLNTRFIELSGEVNGRMPRYVVDGLVARLSEISGKAIRGAKVLVVGLAYKKNINDQRESPSLEILEILKEMGADVAYHDPLIPEIPPTRKHATLQGMASVAPGEAHWDAAVVVTDHDAVDYEALLGQSGLVIDTRNVYGGTAHPETGRRIFAY
ncbi:UDP-N-acetyl-D-glucosamine 6-dehydrogenase [Roseobacter cerasinus]|uniref:UDP-N-acetyl-D-glucosamine 6-dehydrogenase n=1 Tax=Roseobacter cerasinus TaxID=2602289 RepID=A0A640VWT8_9RHOB|nr:nucleotide sugar dehydrogenase [Roseobacter cerasinus]GFE52489.1 UDP-N-acetyl-D-glucosamine 6-dehydrogenase [Roseobacter cerasinus]